MALTYELISSQTAGGAVVTFSSIPATYTDLVLVQQHAVTTNATDTNGFFRLNADTNATNTYQNQLNGIADYYTPWSAISWFADTSVGSNASGIVFQIFNYTSTDMGKPFTMHVFGSGGNDYQQFIGYWSNLSAVTTIEAYASDRWRNVGASPDNFNGNSTFTLYGIKEA